MQTQFYFLSPVEVVRVTPKNLEEVAEWCGGKVAQTESKNRPGTLDSYIWVPTPKNSNLSAAFPGMFITKRIVVSPNKELKVTWAVFRRDYFEKNYFDSPAEAVDETWEKLERKKKREKVPVVRELQNGAGVAYNGEGRPIQDENDETQLPEMKPTDTSEEATA